jgi:hypothetical protein
MTTLLSPSQLAEEDRIVWLEPIDRLDYVRETLARYCARRQAKPPWTRKDSRLVGYSTVRERPRGQRTHWGFARRLFWLEAHDRDSQPQGVYARALAPSEAVDPRTVAVGVPGELTERAWGAPLPVNSRNAATLALIPPTVTFSGRPGVA